MLTKDGLTVNEHGDLSIMAKREVERWREAIMFVPTKQVTVEELKKIYPPKKK
jgi:hypothetical protein